MANEFIYFVISGFVLLILPIVFLANFWLKGFLMSFLKVKASQGSKTMVRAWNITHWTFVTGTIIDGFLIFKFNKENRRIKIETNDFYRMLKVSWIDINVEEGSISRNRENKVTGFDAVKFDDLYVRALYKPQIKDTKTMIIIFLLAFVLIVVLVQTGMLFQVYQIVQELSLQNTGAVGVV